MVYVFYISSITWYNEQLFHGITILELVHRTVFKTKIMKKIFLNIFGILGWHNFHEYRYSHT